jgi:predicted nucleic acid-binding Zn ribbon protein
MTWTKNLNKAQIGFLLLMPIAAWAINWSMNGYTAPRAFRDAASSLGLRVTEVCRSMSANYGARYSLHKKCQAMDIGRETSKDKISALQRFGLCPEFHTAGTAPHWHVTVCSTYQSRGEARRDQRERAQDIRNQNRGRARSGRARTEYRSAPAPSMNWVDQAFGRN